MLGKAHLQIKKISANIFGEQSRKPFFMNTKLNFWWWYAFTGLFQAGSFPRS